MELTACRYLILWRAVGARWLSFPDRPDGPILQISPWPFREISFKKYFVSPNCSVKNITPKKNSQLAVFSPVTMWINLQQFMVIYHASLSYLRMHCTVSVLRLISKFSCKFGQSFAKNWRILSSLVLFEFLTVTRFRLDSNLQKKELDQHFLHSRPNKVVLIDHFLDIKKPCKNN